MSVKRVSETVDRIQKILVTMASAKAAPDDAREEMKGAVVGHKNWDGYGVREIRGKDLHERAVSAVTDYLVDDLTERKRVELLSLADELDQLRLTLVDQVAELRFALIDDILAAREWRRK